MTTLRFGAKTRFSSWKTVKFLTVRDVRKFFMSDALDYIVYKPQTISFILFLEALWLPCHFPDFIRHVPLDVGIWF
jgi:hypothetical protein